MGHEVESCSAACWLLLELTGFAQPGALRPDALQSRLYPVGRLGRRFAGDMPPWRGRSREYRSGGGRRIRRESSTVSIMQSPWFLQYAHLIFKRLSVAREKIGSYVEGAGAGAGVEAGPCRISPTRPGRNSAFLHRTSNIIKMPVHSTSTAISSNSSYLHTAKFFHSALLRFCFLR